MKIIGKFSLIISALAVVFALAAPSLRASALFDNAKSEACSGVALNDATGTPCPDTGNTVNGLLKTALNIFSVVIGFIAIIMIFVGGLKYITSAGDSNNVNSAKNTILYAVIGLVIVALAQVIVRFVLSKTKTS